MNTYETIDVSYFCSSRTIETISLNNGEKERLISVYNFEGLHFRVFKNLVDLINFFDDDFEPNISFENENELDEFLEKSRLEIGN